MNKMCMLAAASILALAYVSAGFALQEKKPQPKAGTSQDEQPWMAAAKPGAAHAQLLKRVGNWTTATQMRMGPAQPAMQTIGTAKITSILEGRFIQEEAAGTMSGMPFTSTRITGYNNGSKHYESMWVYTHGTNMLLANGTSKDDGKTIDWTASFDNEIGVKETVDIHTNNIDDDHFSVTLHGKHPDGTEITMETAYTRAK